jgi:protein-L-isoaspartate(D-aspartate) O-methyltransferase
MVDSQLRPSGVNARYVLERMLAVPREDFVPAEARASAYIDRAVPLGGGRFLASAEFHGLMLQEAAPTKADRALVVDGGSGYLPELLHPLVGTLSVAIPEAAVRGDVAGGPFTLLLIDGAVEQVPDALAALMTSDGRAITGLVEGNVTRLAAGRRAGEALALLPLAELGIPLLPAFAKPKAWSF